MMMMILPSLCFCEVQKSAFVHEILCLYSIKKIIITFPPTWKCITHKGTFSLHKKKLFFVPLYNETTEAWIKFPYKFCSINYLYLWNWQRNYSLIKTLFREMSRKCRLVFWGRHIFWSIFLLNPRVTASNQKRSG